MTQIEAEGFWLSALELQAKQRFLACLAFELTIASRSTYEPGTDNLSVPQRLRALNEIQHKVLGCLCKVSVGNNRDLFEPIVAKQVLSHDSEELAVLMHAAWLNAKDRMTIDQSTVAQLNQF